MIIVAGEIKVDEGAIDAVLEDVRTMVRKTNEEEGCIAYAFSLDLCDPTIVRIYERWASEAALAAHMESAHMADFQKAVVKAAPKSLDIKFFEVAGEIQPPR